MSYLSCSYDHTLYCTLLYHDLGQFQHGVAAAAPRPGALHVAPAAPAGLPGAHSLPARADVFPFASATLIASHAATVSAPTVGGRWNSVFRLQMVRAVFHLVFFTVVAALVLMIVILIR
jgi:hypothetical protein